MEEEIKKEKWLDKVDAKAETKGRGIKLLWQIVKFGAVGILITLIQLLLVNVLYFCLKDWKAPLGSFLDQIFTANTVGEGNNNCGYVLPFFLSNAIANAVGYFLNKNKTFKSDAPIWHFIIYFIFLILLILFSTWLQGVVVNAINNTNVNWLMKLAPTIAAGVAGLLQMVILFPLQKFVLLREKKKPVEEPSTGESK